MTRFCTILFLLAAFPPVIAAQQHGGCEERMFPVNVVDARSQQILGLTREQFHVELRGQRVNVLSVKFESGAQRILMLVDVSGSMWSDAQQRELIELVADDMVSSGPPQAQLALSTFSDKFETIVKFGQGREAVREGILGLNHASKTTSSPSPSAETALNDAILEAADMFGSPETGDIVYVLTDGLDNESKSSTEKVRQYLEKRNIRLFGSVIHNGRFLPLSMGAADGPELLGNTAKETGGYSTRLEVDHLKDSTLGTSDNAVHQLYKLMASFYLLDIELPTDPDKPRELKLTVANADGSKKKGTIVLYPQKIFPCDTTR